MHRPSNLQTLRGLAKAARPRQWVKNLFVGAPLVFSKNLLDPEPAIRAAAAVAIFCVLSSAVYLWNDIIDLDHDRQHPTKRHRPIASGLLPLRLARPLTGLVAVAGLGAAFVLSDAFAWTALAYLAINVAYSLLLKRIIFVDVLTIASGFLLRVLGGALVISVDASPYLLLCTALLASYLGFGKRAHELAQLTSSGASGEQRPVLRGYTSPSLRTALYLTGLATLVVYVLYTHADHTQRYFGTTRMIWTSPFAAFGLYRFIRLVRSPGSDSPTDAMLRDLPFVANFVLWAIAAVAIIYFKP